MAVLLAACGGRPTTGGDGGPPPPDQWRWETPPVPDKARPDWRSDSRRDGPWFPDWGKPDKVPPKWDVLPVASETVTCNFLGATGVQECVSTLGHACKGVGSCSMKISGVVGTKLSWKSSCGASAPSTVIDGKSESLIFTCGPAPVVETVTCLFKGSNKVEECYSAKGPSCKGLGSCSVTVTGMAGEMVEWKTTCGGYYSTILDGKNDTISVNCGSTGVTESMTCVFQGATKLETCTSSKGPSCSGYGSCTATVSGSLYEKVDWKSSCGTTQYTSILDGMPEKATFFCTSSLSETVTCLFPGSKVAQQCFSPKGSCSGIASCSVAVKGTLYETVSWQSSCGGNATTVVDGKSETISFPCLPQPPASEWVTCLFKGSTTYQECTSSKGSCKGLLGCTIYVSGTMGEKVEWKSTCGGYAYTVIDGNPEPANFVCGPQPGDGWVWPDAGVPPPIPDASWQG